MEDNPDSDRKLPKSGFLGHLDAELRERLAAAGRFMVAPVGEYLAIQGKEHSSLAVILAGKVAVTAHAHGDTIELATVGAGHTVGEMSVIDSGKASANARVVEEPALLWLIEGEDFERFVQSDTAAGMKIFRAIACELCGRLRLDSEAMLRRKDELRSRFLDMDY